MIGDGIDNDCDGDIDEELCDLAGMCFRDIQVFISWLIVRKR